MNEQYSMVFFLCVAAMFSTSCGDAGAVDTSAYLTDSSSAIKTGALQDEPSRLLLKLFPVAGAVYVDRELVGSAASGETLAISLAPGLHEVAVLRSGYHSHISTIRIAKNETRAAIVRLTSNRQHLGSEPKNRVIRPGMTMSGEFTLKAPLAKDTFQEANLKIEPAVESARALKIRIENAPTNRFQVRVANFGSRLNIYVVDDQGQVLAESLAKTWSPRFNIKPEPGRTYSIIMAHAAMLKNDAFNLVRYSVYVVPEPAKKK